MDRVKKYGEVFTPIELVDDMLNTLPGDVWTNPELKWLEPSNGTGNFSIRVLERLMEGLSEWEPDKYKRYNHIVNNMLYTCELLEDNNEIYKLRLKEYYEHL